jgi:hypothetical protein
MKWPEKYRDFCTGTVYQTKAGDPYGMFLIPATNGRMLRVVASDGNDGSQDYGWEHVSVSLPAFYNKSPGWDVPSEGSVLG